MKSVTVEGRTLAAALKPMLLVIERRNTIPILSYAMLRVTAAELTISGTDLDIEISTAIDIIDQTEEFDICLPARTLFDIAAQAGPAPVKLSVMSQQSKSAKGDPYWSDTVEIDVADGDAKYSMQPLPATDFPTMKAGAWAPIESFTNGRLAALLEKVSPCISTEETRYYLNGVCWQWAGGSSLFVATDGHRLATAKYGSHVDPDAAMSIIIPRKTVNVIQTLAKGKDVAIAGMNGGKLETATTHLSFTFGRTVIVSKTIDGTFPDWQRVVPKANQYVIEFDRERTRAALNRVAMMSSEQGRAVRIHADNDGNARLGVKSPDHGEASAKTFAPWPKATNTTEFGFNATYFRQVIGNGPGSFRLRFADAGSPFLIEDDADEEMTRVLMPMRV